MTYIWSNIKMAIHALWINKVRSILTLLGIVIGISSVVIIVASGEGVQQFILNQIQGFGTNVLTVTPGGTDGESFGPPAAVMGITVTTLTMEDANAIADKRNAPDVQDVGAASQTGQAVVSGADGDLFVSVYGITPNYFDIMNTKFKAGGSFTEDDVKSMNKVAIITAKIKDKVFGAEDAIGKRIKVGNYRYRIVGVSEDESGMFSSMMDKIVYVPVTVAQKFVVGVDYLQEILVRTTSEERLDAAKSDIVNLLRDRHNITDAKNDDFSIRTIKDALKTIKLVTGALTLFLAAIAAISLLVGGIGIMNIMLVSVTERTREIGLRKALGAKQRDILVQFLLEAISLTCIGGLIGFIFGITGAFITSQVGGWAFSISPSAILLPLIMTVSFGVIFGLYPAMRAAKMDPIVALRYE